MKIMPPEPTLKMLEAAEAALTNPTVKNPKAAAWDALVAYRAMWRVAPEAEETSA